MQRPLQPRPTSRGVAGHRLRRRGAADAVHAGDAPGPDRLLIAASPLLLLGFALEQTEPWAHGYARVSAGLVLIVPGLKTASVVSSLGAGIVGAGLGIVVQLMIRALPGLLAGMNMPSSSIGIFGRLLQFAVLKQIAR